MAINPNDITTIRVGDLPPASFSLTDKIPHEVGTDLKSGTIQDLVTLLAPLLTAIQFEVKVLHVNSDYIAANFETNGLGKNLMLGYAICNGNNGTINKDGRVGIAYGATRNVIGQTGGSATHTLSLNEIPAHNHTIDMGQENFQAGGNTNASSNTTTGSGVHFKTSSTKGSGQPHNNMQPYLVELHIMKL